jgi:hypothetical protein
MGNGLALGVIVSRTTLWIFGGPTSWKSHHIHFSLHPLTTTPLFFSFLFTKHPELLYQFEKQDADSSTVTKPPAHCPLVPPQSPPVFLNLWNKNKISILLLWSSSVWSRDNGVAYANLICTPFLTSEPVQLYPLFSAVTFLSMNVLLTAWSWALLEKPIVHSHTRNCQHFMQPYG